MKPCFTKRIWKGIVQALFSGCNIYIYEQVEMRAYVYRYSMFVKPDEKLLRKYGWKLRFIIKPKKCATGIN